MPDTPTSDMPSRETPSRETPSRETPSSRAPVTSRSRDRSYLPTVLVGLAGAGLAAVAGSRQWAVTHADAAGIKVDTSVTGAQAQPLVAAAALVALAAWGVVLVTRGRRLRRVVAVVGLVASLGALVTVALGFTAVQDAALEAAIAKGATDAFVTSLSIWYYLSGLGAALATGAFAVAVVRSPGWPAMGAKYDAPAARSGPPAEEDMWRALDEGRDPTS